MQIPDWYWVKGLHDAQVTDLSFIDFDYDYTKRNPTRNCMTIQLDTRSAMFDTSIKAIKLLNSKIVQGDTDFVGWFWKDDILKPSHKGFELQITLISNRNTKICKISFENAIVEK